MKLKLTFRDKITIGKWGVFAVCQAAIWKVVENVVTNTTPKGGKVKDRILIGLGTYLVAAYATNQVLARTNEFVDKAVDAVERERYKRNV